MRNMKQITSSHKKTVLESTKIKEKQGKTCKCREKKILPAQRSVSPKRVVYKVTVEQKSSTKTRHLHRNNRK